MMRKKQTEQKEGEEPEGVRGRSLNTKGRKRKEEQDEAEA